MERYLHHVRRKLWSDEPGCCLCVADNPLADHRLGRGLARAMGGMSKFTSYFHIVGPGDREWQCSRWYGTSPQKRLTYTPPSGNRWHDVQSYTQGPHQVQANAGCSDREITGHWANGIVNCVFWGCHYLKATVLYFLIFWKLFFFSFLFLFF